MIIDTEQLRKAIEARIERARSSGGPIAEIIAERLEDALHHLTEVELVASLMRINEQPR